MVSDRTGTEGEMCKELVTLENNYSLKTLFSQNINIPNYQRGYCWEEPQIKTFLESLWFADKRLPYHLGTIIVHIHDNVWDIVDGQQRLITLSILQYCLSNHKNSKTDSKNECYISHCKQSPSLLRSVTCDSDMLWHVHDAAMIIKEWINCHQIDKNLNYALGVYNSETETFDVCFAVVKIMEQNDNCNQNLPLAWTFFNAINSGGKSLSDYDLLKAHHLRHLTQNADNLTIQFKASRWDYLGEQAIASLFSQTNMLFDDSFAKTFYLIRTWLHNRNVDIYQMPADSRYCILNHYSSLTSLTINNEGLMKKITSGIVGGMSFFDWIEYWLWQYRQFCENPIICRFFKVPWKWQQIHLLIIAKAIMFFYFCRFGSVNLADACVFILYRIGKLRNTRQRLDVWYGNNDKYVQHTLEALDESPTPEHFFYYCQMPSNRYVPKYDLKKAIYEMDDNEKKKLNGWNHGPDWWKRFLAFSASSVDKDCCCPSVESIGESVCFKEQIAELLNDVAKDFGWKYNSTLMLKNN